MEKPNIDLYLAAPRGFCAGVDRAIKIVEMALEKWGAPVFVRHEIVHNKYVVDELRSKGDGDFQSLVKSLQRQGVRVSVVSTNRSHPPMIADELRRQADNFIDLEELRDVISQN